MWFWQKNKRRDLISIQIIEGMKNLDKRIRELERAHNQAAEALEKLGQTPHGLVWNEKTKEWKREYESVPCYRPPMVGTHSKEV